VLEIDQIVKERRKLDIGSYALLTTVYENKDETPIELFGFDITLFNIDISGIFQDVGDYKIRFRSISTYKESKWFEGGG
jgi:hypothetical protein